MKRVLGAFFLFVVAFVLPSFGSGSVERDLGEGLIYLRVVTTQSDSGERALALPTALSGEAALVLDLRYVAGAEREAQRLSEWLSAHADRSLGMLPVFFLVNAETAPELREVAAQFAQSYRALLIGPTGDGVLPDIALAIDAQEERAAYTALASGEADIAGLIGEGVAADKRRYDEAAVIAAHAAQEAGHEPTEGAAPRRRRSGAASAEIAESTKEVGNAVLVRPVDLALQRAIHLHRAWRVFEQHP